MNEDIKQKAAELTRAQSQCAFLANEHLLAKEAFDLYGRAADLMVATVSWSLLVEAREHKSQLDKALLEAKQDQNEDNTDCGSWEFSVPGINPANLTFAQLAKTVRVGFAVFVGFVIVMAVCSMIGW